MFEANPYDVLGLDRGADAEAVKRRYRAVAKELHPDVSKHPDADRLMAAAAEAYRFLMEAKRDDGALIKLPYGATILREDLPDEEMWRLVYRAKWCHWCGKTLHGKSPYGTGTRVQAYRRRDALDRSNACRQAAYRERKRGKKTLAKARRASRTEVQSRNTAPYPAKRAVPWSPGGPSWRRISR